MGIGEIDNKVPLTIFAYKRPAHLRKVLEATLGMQDINAVRLHIFIDGPRTPEESELVHETWEVASQYALENDGVVTLSNENKGLSKSIIGGVSTILQDNKSIIVLEDDLVGSKFFLEYSLNGLEAYRQESRVSSIHGYLPSIKSPGGQPFFRRGADCWGWSTWQDRWHSTEWDANSLLENLRKHKLTRELNLNGAYCYSCMLERQAVGAIDSWAIRWHISMFLQGRLALYPSHSLIQNIGFDGSGRHGGKNNFYETRTCDKPVSPLKVPVVESRKARRRLAKHYRITFRNSRRRRLKKFIQRRFSR
jgi:hypothetical protein